MDCDDIAFLQVCEGRTERNWRHLSGQQERNQGWAWVLSKVVAISFYAWSARERERLEPRSQTNRDTEAPNGISSCSLPCVLYPACAAGDRARLC